MILDHYITYCNFHRFSSCQHYSWYFPSCFLYKYIYYLFRWIIFAIFESGKVSLNLSSITLAAQLLLVSQSQPWVQAQSRLSGLGWCQLSRCAGGWNKVPGCSGCSCRNLPAGTFASLLILCHDRNGKAALKGTRHGKPLAHCIFEVKEYLEHLSSAGKDILLVKIYAFIHETMKTACWG